MSITKKKTLGYFPAVPVLATVCSLKCYTKNGNAYTTLQTVYIKREMTGQYKARFCRSLKIFARNQHTRKAHVLLIHRVLHGGSSHKLRVEDLLEPRHCRWTCRVHCRGSHVPCQLDTLHSLHHTLPLNPKQQQLSHRLIVKRAPATQEGTLNEEAQKVVSRKNYNENKDFCH